MDNKESAIKAIKEKLSKHNSPEVEKALKLKLKILEGNKTVLK